MIIRVRWNFVRRRAAQLLSECGIDQPPINVDVIAEALKITVYESALDSEVSGMLIYKDKIPCIYVNESHHEHRKRFSIGHELGHFYLEHELRDKVHVDRRYRVAALRNERSSQGTEPMEIEANEFAANLLMPTAMLLEAAKEYEKPLDDLDIADLADYFKVSKIAMSHRVARLDLLDLV